MKVEIKNVSKNFKQVKALNNVSMRLEEGKIYGFIGPNGSGKTVLLKIICAFYAPSSGTILIDGKNVIKEQSYPLNTGALIEKPSFMPDLTGKENLLYLASINNKIVEKDIDDIIKVVGLDNYIDHKYNTYSLGTKQKLGIAQALMEKPNLIILDEPFNGLDEKSAASVRAYLKEQKKQGCLIIISTHIKEDLTKLVDETYLFEEGEVTLLKNK